MHQTSERSCSSSVRRIDILDLDASELTMCPLPRLEKALDNPENLAQETIVANLDPIEAARLDKLRNIGIAVRNPA